MSSPVSARFELIDHHGNPVDNTSYRGRFPLVFFGFTHCEVICPRALAKLSTVLRRLGPLARPLVPLYITVDPDRDTPERMKQFLERNYPLFTGLTGAPDALEAARREFRVFAVRRDNPDGSGDYQMPHSAITYLLDVDGAYLTHFLDSLDEDELTRRLRSTLTAHAG
jgi:protein SCO1